MPATVRLFVMMSFGLALLGCNDATPEPAAAAPTYDLEAIMRGFAESIRSENNILTQALGSWDAIDDEDRRKYWSALQEQMRLGGEFNAMLRANPTWTEPSCDWFESVVATVVAERARLHDRLGRPSDRRRLSMLLLEAAGSGEAASAYLTWNHDDAGSPTNIAGLCD